MTFHIRATFVNIKNLIIAPEKNWEYKNQKNEPLTPYTTQFSDPIFWQYKKTLN